MPLVDVRGFNLNPDILGAAHGGLRFSQETALRNQALRAGELGLSEAEAEQAKQARWQGLMGQILGQQPAQQPTKLGPGQAQPGPTQQPFAGRQQALAQAMIERPEIGRKIFDNLGAMEEREMDNAARFATFALSADPAERPAMFQKHIANMRARGENPAGFIEMAQLPIRQQNARLEATQIAALDPKQRMEVSRGTKTLQKIVEAAGGGFIGIDPEKRESVFIPPPSGKRTKAHVEKERKEQEARVEKETKDLETRFDRSEKLRKEVDNASKEFNKIASAFGRIEAVTEEPSAAGDLALIFNFMKMLDPGSTVREGEFATAQNAAGVPGRVISLYNNIIRGERLNADQRDDFLDQSKKIFDRSKQDNQKAVDKIVSIGKRFDIPKEDILGEIVEKSLSEMTDEELQAEAARLRGQ